MKLSRVYVCLECGISAYDLPDRCEHKKIVYLSQTSLEGMIEEKKVEYEKLLCNSDDQQYRIVMDHKLATLQSILNAVRADEKED